MAQQRSHERGARGQDQVALNAAALVRLGRVAREGLGRAANDNRARVWNRAVGMALIATALAVFGYVLLRWIW